MIYDKESICFLPFFKVAVLNGSLAKQAAVAEGAKYIGNFVAFKIKQYVQLKSPRTQIGLEFSLTIQNAQE